MAYAALARSVAPNGVAPSVWGDGFASDRFEDLMRVRDWRLCSDDELIFLFPALAWRPGEVAPRVRDRLNACIAVHRAGAIAEDSLGRPVDSRFVSMRAVNYVVSAFFGASRAKCVIPSLSHCAGLAVCESVLRQIGEKKPYDFNDEDSARFAFHSGVHPAYVGASNPAFYERDTAAGWLGHMLGGRPVLVPSMLAEYLIDITAPGHGASVGVRDPILAELAPLPFDWVAIRRAATKRLSGSDLVLKFPIARFAA